MQALDIFAGVLLSSLTAMAGDQFMIPNRTQDTVASERFLSMLQTEPSAVAVLDLCSWVGVVQMVSKAKQSQQSAWVCFWCTYFEFIGRKA